MILLSSSGSCKATRLLAVAARGARGSDGRATGGEVTEPGVRADFTAKHHLPAISMFRAFEEAGGLTAYGSHQLEYDGRLTVYIDEILKRGEARDLPIERPTEFDFVLNLKTAKTPGLALPHPLVSRADQVIP